MNAYSRTAHDLANALMGKPRNDIGQKVVVVGKNYGGSPLGPRYTVLVTPDGAERGELYECGERSLALLQTGMTPDDLELDVAEEDDDDADGIPSPESLRRWLNGKVL